MPVPPTPPCARALDTGTRGRYKHATVAPEGTSVCVGVGVGDGSTEGEGSQSTANRAPARNPSPPDIGEEITESHRRGPFFFAINLPMSHT